ncbi:MAG: response regulator [Chromatiaceae bacterium]|nr:response regulator [Chromatiaceae bacterium]
MVTGAVDKAIVLVVDDCLENLRVLVEILKHDYLVKVAASGEAALAVVGATPRPDLILVDVMMPDLDGYEVCRRLKSNPITRAIPVIFVTALTHAEGEAVGFDLGAADYITKPVNPVIVRARVKAQLALFNQARHLETLVRERTRELEQTRLQIVRTLGRAAELKDEESGLHVVRVSLYARRLAEAHGLDNDFCELLLHAAMMHDVGKIGIPDQVLRKPGRLNADELIEIRRHPEIGARILEPPSEHSNPLMDMASVVALTHHERWDGGGYPRGLAGEAIPLAGRIVAVSDVFDALTTARPYKAAWSDAEALALLKQERGRHFDPGLIDTFVEIFPEILAIREELLSENPADALNR